MRIAVLILGILGVCGPALVGFIWREELVKLDPLIELGKLVNDASGKSGDAKTKEGMRNVAKLTQTTFFLLLAVPIGLLGAILAFAGRGLAGGLLLIFCALGPLLLAPDMEIRLRAGAAGGLLLIAGILGLFVRPPAPRVKRKRPPKDKEEEEFDDD